VRIAIPLSLSPLSRRRSGSCFLLSRSLLSRSCSLLTLSRSLLSRSGSLLSRSRSLLTVRLSVHRE
jgi:hypothetical protein